MRESPMMTPGQRNYYKASGTMDASRTTTDSRDEAASISISNASDMESEWIEQDEPGVFITIRQLADGTRELRRVRFRYTFSFIMLAYMIYISWSNNHKTWKPFHTAEKDLERCMQRRGGNRTGREYKRNTFRSKTQTFAKWVATSYNKQWNNFVSLSVYVWSMDTFDQYIQPQFEWGQHCWRRVFSLSCHYDV